MGNNETRSERGRAILVGIKLEGVAHQLAIIADPIFAARLNKELQLVLAHAQRFDDVHTRHEVSDQHWLFVDETKARGAGLINLRRDRFIADTTDLHSRGHNDSDVGCGSIRRIVMERKPARGIHQIRTFGADIRQSLVRQRSTFRRSQRPAPTNSNSHRLGRRHDLAQIDPHIRTERACAHRILHEPGQRLPVLFNAVHMQRAVQFENNRTRGILRHKRNVGAGAQRVLVGIQLDLDPIVGHIIARPGDSLCLRARR